MIEPAAGGTRPPAAALVLGFAGLLPNLLFVAALVVLGRNNPDSEPTGFMIAMPALGYAAVILSFLGGTWWGLAARALGGRVLWLWLTIAVLPSLCACAAFLAGGVLGPPRGTGVILAFGLVAALAADARLTRDGLAPVWWMRLRVPLSLGLAAETLAVAWLA